jgi:hypothetical protein
MGAARFLNGWALPAVRTERNLAQALDPETAERTVSRPRVCDLLERQRAIVAGQATPPDRTFIQLRRIDSPHSCTRLNPGA